MTSPIGLWSTVKPWANSLDTEGGSHLETPHAHLVATWKSQGRHPKSCSALVSYLTVNSQ